MSELKIEARLENVEAVTDFVNEQLEKSDCPMKAQMQIDIAIDEIFSNISRYAYAPQVGFAVVRFDIRKAPLTAVITFTDSGIPYDPLKNADPDVTLSADERQIGGLGIYMVKKTMDSIAYEYKDGCNILTIQKNLE